ncbi:MAG: hypothetical protein GY765_07120, partial [bacterium]|nr:hypothetical protein [bacterium]
MHDKLIAGSTSFVDRLTEAVARLKRDSYIIDDLETAKTKLRRLLDRSPFGTLENDRSESSAADAANPLEYPHHSADGRSYKLQECRDSANRRLYIPEKFQEKHNGNRYMLESFQDKPIRERNILESFQDKPIRERHILESFQDKPNRE